MHDAGRLPSAHILENNALVRRSAGDPNGHIIADLTEGHGFLYDEVDRKAKRYGGQTIRRIPRDYSRSGKRTRDGLAEGGIAVNAALIAELLQSSSRPDIQPLSGLIGGVFGIDRLDYYNRDAYFTGVRLTNAHIAGILENLVLRPGQEPPFGLDEAGEPYLRQVLFAREMVRETVLENDQARYYEAMLDYAVSGAMAAGLTYEGIATMTDDELLHCLSTDERWLDAARLANRILMRQPYTLAAKEQVHGDREMIAQARHTPMITKGG